MPAEPAVQQRGDRRQQVVHGVLHAADVRLRQREAIGRKPPRQLALRQRLAAVRLSCS
jgi:hypothetical protein